MDPFQTPVRKSRFVPRNHRISKSEFINLLTSLDFDEVTVPEEFADSQNEADFQPFVESLVISLGQTIIRNSPPKSTPGKLLTELKTTEKGEKDILPTAYHESIDAESFGTPETPSLKDSLHKENRSQIIRTFLNHNPQIRNQSINLPDDPVEQDRLLQFMSAVNDGLTHMAGIVPFLS
jgi:hypothetical protein